MKTLFKDRQTFDLITEIIKYKYETQFTLAYNNKSRKPYIYITISSDGATNKYII